MGTEAGKSKPVHSAMDQENLLADLKEGLAYVRRRGKGAEAPIIPQSFGYGLKPVPFTLTH